MPRAIPATVLKPALLAGFLAIGCAPGEVVGEATTTAYQLRTNALRPNGWADNGMSPNGVTLNGVRMNGVRMNGVRMNGLSVSGLDTNASLEFLTYAVSCALPAGDALTIFDGDQAYSFDGDLGIAPGLKDGTMDDNQEECLSACLMARTNRLGNHVVISMGGCGIARDDATELVSYTFLEAQYCGNIFADPPWKDVASYVLFNVAGATDWTPTNLVASGRSCERSQVDCMFEQIAGRSSPTCFVVYDAPAELANAALPQIRGCGNGVCEPDENHQSCPSDCVYCAASGQPCHNNNNACCSAICATSDGGLSYYCQ
jgi:hypothetical protein